MSGPGRGGANVPNAAVGATAPPISTSHRANLAGESSRFRVTRSRKENGEEM